MAVNEIIIIALTKYKEMKTIVYKLTDKTLNQASNIRNHYIMKRITGSPLVQTGESSFIQGDYAYHSCVYQNELWKLEILEVEY